MKDFVLKLFVIAVGIALLFTQFAAAFLILSIAYKLGEPVQ